MSSNLTAGAWLRAATAELNQQGIGTAHLDALILLEDVLNKNRTHILAGPSLYLTPAQSKKLKSMLKRRIAHEPMAYLRGKTEFFGREFKITPAVLEPRPESETMIELLLELSTNYKPQTKNLVLADIGTGSGALAVTAKLEMPYSEVLATDIDPKCLVVAKQNALKHKTTIEFLQGDLLEPLLTTHYSLLTILANLPYVPDKYLLNQAAGKEPKIAIFGGKDGLDVYRKFFEQIKNMQSEPKFIFTESLPFQHKDLQKIAASADYKLRQSEDFIQVFEPK